MAVVLAGLCIAQMVVWTAVSAFATDGSARSSVRTLTFTELERGATFTHIRNARRAPRQANLQGDVIAFTAPLADGSRKRVGKTSASCTTTTGARNFTKSAMTCIGVAELADGTLTSQFNTRPRGPITGAITGGTGAYANARGVFTSKPTRGGTVDTITLAD